MFNKVTKTFQYGQHTVTLETGEIARQASGAVLDRDEYGTGCLTGDFAGFKRDLMLAILEGFSDFIKHGVPF